MVRIITDSTSDLTQEDGATLGVIVVPLTVHFGDETFRDGVDLSKKEFFDRLSTVDVLPTTSQVPPGEFTPLFQKYIDNGDEIVGIFISSRLSGTCQSADVARGLVCPDRIHIVDSMSATFQLGLLVFEAIRYRDAGKSAAEIAQLLRRLVPRVRLFAVVDTLKYLRMSGRISTATAFVGGLLGVTPIITIAGGIVESIGKTRGLKPGLKFIADQLRADPPDLSHTVVYGHINAPDSLRETVSYLSEQFSISSYQEMDIGITVGTHVGPGAAGIAYIAKEKGE